MSERTTEVARAIRMLTEQLEALGNLRNANTRDPIFKQWRQNTLTAIQRIWTGDPVRVERFRRVPFSAPSSKAETKAVRECYERGCAEAAVCLRALIAEIERVGVPASAEAPRPASLDPGVAEDDFPTVDLPGGPPPASVPAPGEATPDAEARASAPVFEMPAPPPVEPVESVKARAARSATGKTSVRAAKNGRKGSHKQRLKDMLGFSDDEPVAEAVAPTPIPEAAAPAPVFEAVAPTPVHEAVAPTPVPEAKAPASPPAPVARETTNAEMEALLEDVCAPAPSAEISAERAVAEDAALAEAEAERAMDDFLRMSPVFSSHARPVERRLAGGVGSFSAPAALALAALAADLDAIDVPEGHRARARATLLDLARHMDVHDLSWEALRDGVTFAMEFPAIGRRVLPLLVPYLDQAA